MEIDCPQGLMSTDNYQTKILNESGNIINIPNMEN